MSHLSPIARQILRSESPEGMGGVKPRVSPRTRSMKGDVKNKLLLTWLPEIFGGQPRPRRWLRTGCAASSSLSLTGRDSAKRTPRTNSGMAAELIACFGLLLDCVVYLDLLLSFCRSIAAIVSVVLRPSSSCSL